MITPLPRGCGNVKTEPKRRPFLHPADERNTRIENQGARLEFSRVLRADCRDFWIMNRVSDALSELASQSCGIISDGYIAMTFEPTN